VVLSVEAGSLPPVRDDNHPGHRQVHWTQDERKVILMACAFFLLVCLIVAGVVASRPQLRRAFLDVAGKPAASVAPGGDCPPDHSPQTLEGVLTRQLVTGQISGPQYRHAMANIAIRDAERHPLEVPPEVNPPEAA
jgi:hypothetical protein